MRSLAKVAAALLSVSSAMVLTKAEAAAGEKATSVEDVNDAKEIRKNRIKMRASAFYPQGSLTREIYGNWFPVGSLEYDYLYGRHLSFFVNGAYTRKNGHSTAEAYKTTITLVPVTVGVNAQLGNSSWWRPYLGAGIGAAYSHFHNYSPYVKQHRSYFGFASIIQTGMEFNITKWFFLDLFTSYRFNWFDFNKDNSKSLTGGVDLGIGLGVKF